MPDQVPGVGVFGGVLPAAKDGWGRRRGLSLPRVRFSHPGKQGGRWAVGDPGLPPPSGSPQLGATSLAWLRILPCLKPAPPTPGARSPGAGAGPGEAEEGSGPGKARPA